MDSFWEKGQCTAHIVDSEKSTQHVHAGDDTSWEGEVVCGYHHSYARDLM